MTAGADENDLMSHGVGGIFAFKFGRGQCWFVGMLARADAELFVCR